MFTAFAIAPMTLAACAGSRIRLQPALCFAIFGTGHPMLTSTMSAPIPSTTCAAAAIFSGSPPNICTDTGRSSSVYSAYSSVRSMPRIKPSALTISVTTRPQPPRRLTSRRKAVSVMPAIGAMANGETRSTDPIFISEPCYRSAMPPRFSRRAALWVPPLVYMGIIYYLSAQSDPMPRVTAVVWDKLLHFVEYGGLATLFARALLGEGLTVAATIVAAVVLTSAYGASDEIHQSTVPQRQAD